MNKLKNMMLRYKSFVPMPGRVYMLRSLGNVAHEVYDVTDPAAPEFIVTVVRTGDSPPMEPGADFYDTKGTHKNWWDCETGAAYLVSSITGWPVCSKAGRR